MAVTPSWEIKRTAKPRAVRKNDGYEYITFKKYQDAYNTGDDRIEYTLKSTCVHGLLILIRLTGLFRWAMQSMSAEVWRKSFTGREKRTAPLRKNNCTSGFG